VAGRRVRTVDTHDYVVHDTPRSLSKSEAYHQSYVALLDRMLAAEPPPWAIPIVHNKRCAALHDLSVRAMHSGRWRESLQLHVRSLRPPHGLKYFAYGRHILANALGLAT
jgi:hypothetical protein